MSDIFDQIREAGANLSKKFDEMAEDFKEQINKIYMDGFKNGLEIGRKIGYKKDFEDGKSCYNERE